MSYDEPRYVMNFGTSLIWVNILIILDKWELNCLKLPFQKLLKKGV